MKKLELNEMEFVGGEEHGVGDCIAASAGFVLAAAVFVTLPATVAFVPFMLAGAQYALSVKTVLSWCD